MTLFPKLTKVAGIGCASLAFCLCSVLPAFSSNGRWLKSHLPQGIHDTFAQVPDRASTDAKVLLDRGTEQYKLEQFAEAIALWQQALDRYRASSDRGGERAALANLGIAHRALGEYVSAMEYLMQALDLSQSMGDRLNTAKIEINLANAYEALGEYDSALEHYQQSLTVFQAEGDRLHEAIALGNLGALHATLGDYDRAIVYYKQSLDISQEIGDRMGMVHTLYNLGVARYVQKQYEDALEHYQQSLNRAREFGDRRTEILALTGMGITYEQLQNYDRAIALHQESLDIARELAMPREEAMARNNLAHTLLVSGQLQAAEQQLYRAIAILDGLRSQLNADRWQVSLFDTQVLTYNLLQQVLVARGEYEAALEVSEWGRARAFARLLGGQPSSRSAAEPPPLTIEQIRQVAREQHTMLVQYAIVPEEFLAQGTQRGQGAELYIWVVKPNGTVTFRRSDFSGLDISLANAVLAARCPNQYCQQEVASRGTAPAAINPALMNRKPSEADSQSPENNYLRQLHQVLIDPIRDLLPDNPEEAIAFIPQDVLFLLPFAALQDGAGEYLIERHTMLTTPSIQTLAHTRALVDNRANSVAQSASEVGTEVATVVVGNPKMPPDRLGAVLSPLPAAEMEAQQIAFMMGVQPLLGDRATEPAVVNLLPEARVIHLATHGIFNDVRGNESAIALTPDSEADGWLTAEEIFNLNLTAELVVLSACSTGRGKITGDGVIGLSRSLMAAGVSSVIASLWNVQDASTALLMNRFYHHWLQEDKGKASALRQAMLDTMESFPHPYYWSAFTLIGEAEIGGAD